VLSSSPLARRAPPQIGPVWIVSVEPPIFLTGIPWDDYLGFARPFAERFRNIDAAFIVFPTWSLERPGVPEAIAERYAAHRARFPRHRFHFIANTFREAELLQGQHLPSEFLNKNFTVSERLFCPLPGVEVEFDAVYNARLVPEKRHELAAEIERVGYVAYVEPYPHRIAQFETIHRAILAGRPGHRLLNPLKDGQPVTMSSQDVNAALARASVGLILSEVEGSSYGSMEYMLAGLPVVSTPSVGGRDVYFDPEFCLVCEPDAASVRDAVAELEARAVPREVVRMQTLEKIAPARARFLEIVDDMLGQLGATRRLSGRDWPFLGWSGVPWASYAAHLEMFVQAQRTGLTLRLGLDPRLLADVQLTAAELGTIVNAVRERPCCRLLVFGCGNDTPFWERVNADGETAFIEDDPRWATAARAALQTSPVYLVDYGTRLGDWRLLLDAPHRLLMEFPPEILDQPWDVVLVDGPAGHDAFSPGRMKSIFAAANLVGPGGVVFVHDSEREVEGAFAARYLGDERLFSEVRGRALLRGYRF